MYKLSLVSYGDYSVHNLSDPRVPAKIVAFHCAAFAAVYSTNEGSYALQISLPLQNNILAKLRKSLSALTFSIHNQSTIISFASSPYSDVLFGLSRNSHVFVWDFSLPDPVLLFDIDLNLYAETLITGTLLSPIEKQYIHPFSCKLNPESSFVCAYTPRLNDEDPKFYIFKFNILDSTKPKLIFKTKISSIIENENSSFYDVPDIDDTLVLIDFKVHEDPKRENKWIIWALFETDFNETVVKYLEDVTFTNEGNPKDFLFFEGRWKSVFLNSSNLIETIEENNISTKNLIEIQSTFSTAIFSNRSFSMGQIVNGLIEYYQTSQDYEDEFEINLADLGWSELKARVTGLVLTIENVEEDSVDLDSVLAEYHKFFNILCRIRRDDLVPLRIEVGGDKDVDSNGIFVYRKGSKSIIREIETLELISSHMNAVSSSQYTHCGPNLYNFITSIDQPQLSKSRMDILKISTALYKLSLNIDQSFVLKVLKRASLKISTEQDIKSFNEIAKEIVDFDAQNVIEDVDSTVYMKEFLIGLAVDDFEDLIDSFISMFERTSHDKIDDILNSRQTDDDSAFSISLMSWTVLSIIECRTEVAKNLLLLILFRSVFTESLTSTNSLSTKSSSKKSTTNKHLTDSKAFKILTIYHSYQTLSDLLNKTALFYHQTDQDFVVEKFIVEGLVLDSFWLNNPDKGLIDIQLTGISSKDQPVGLLQYAKKFIEKMYIFEQHPQQPANSRGPKVLSGASLTVSESFLAAIVSLQRNTDNFGRDYLYAVFKDIPKFECDAVVSFLWGFCLVNLAAAGKKDAVIDDGVGCWDMSIDTLEKANPFYGEQKHDSSLVFPINIIENGQKSAHEGMIAYFSWISSIYEENSYPLGEIHFTKLAINECRFLDESDADAKRDLLLKSLFGKFDGLQLMDEAYDCILRITDLTMKRECLRVFVGSLIDRGNIDALCRFSFLGMEEEVEETVLFKARNSEIGEFSVSGESRNYYEILYAYYVHKSDFKSAAFVMNHYSNRIDDVLDQRDSIDVPYLFSQKARALLASLNALALVRDQDQYLLIFKNIVDKNNNSENIFFGIPQKQTKTPTSKSILVTVVDIQKQYSLCLAKLNSIRQFRDVNINDKSKLDPKAAVFSYISSQNFDMAISVTRIFKLDMDVIFISLAENLSKTLKKQSGYVKGNFSGVGCGLDAWEKIEEYLGAFDGVFTGFRYRKFFLKTLFRLYRDVKIPNWLLTHCKKNKPEDLLRILIENNLLKEAVELAVWLIQKETGADASRLVAKVSQNRLPYLLIEQLFVAVGESGMLKVDLNRWMGVYLDSVAEKGSLL